MSAWLAVSMTVLMAALSRPIRPQSAAHENNFQAKLYCDLWRICLRLPHTSRLLQSHPVVRTIMPPEKLHQLNDQFRPRA
jgi:hypothetical protein